MSIPYSFQEYDQGSFVQAEVET